MSNVRTLSATYNQHQQPLLTACDESAFAIDQIRVLTLTAATVGRSVQEDVLAALFANLDAEVARMKQACGFSPK